MQRNEAEVSQSDQWCDIGYEYLDINNYLGAKQSFDCAIKLNSNNVMAWYHRGISYFFMGQDVNAAQDFEQAIMLNPGFADAYRSRGVCYFISRQYDLAEVCFSAALSIQPSDEATYFVRAEMYHMQGMLIEALSNYVKTLILDPGHQAAKNKLTEILSLNTQHDIFESIKKLPHDEQVQMLQQAIDSKTELGKFFSHTEFVWRAKSKAGDYIHAVSAYLAELNSHNEVKSLSVPVSVTQNSIFTSCSEGRVTRGMVNNHDDTTHEHKRLHTI